jgi:hypothetical protein
MNKRIKKKQADLRSKLHNSYHELRVYRRVQHQFVVEARQHGYKIISGLDIWSETLRFKHRINLR